MAQRREIPPFRIDAAQIMFLNFAGKEGPYNPPGDRSFCVVLPPDLNVAQMVEDGWNVKYLDGREEGEPDVPYINVRVSFEHRPPLIVVLTSNSRTRLTEDMVETLDYANIQNVDLMCNGSFWEVSGKSGIKAYLKTMFVTIEEDELERKYADIQFGSEI